VEHVFEFHCPEDISINVTPAILASLGQIHWQNTSAAQSKTSTEFALLSLEPQTAFSLSWKSLSALSKVQFVVPYTIKDDSSAKPFWNISVSAKYSFMLGK
jgi:hypothetical protein